ncbi:MAG: riboflavin synthase [Candidatus Delongbacteria bacterium]
MFTGIIKDVGMIRHVSMIGDGYEISVVSEKITSDCLPDDSVAVNGICLTVVKKSGDVFTVQAVKETVTKSNISSFYTGREVNLEPALKVEDRLGGHIVQGHIDGTGTVFRINKNRNGKEFFIRTDSSTSKYIVTKGSVCIDGISLTVAECCGDDFKVAVIPHTELNTTVKNWKTGTKINIETDIIGRYTEKFLQIGKESISIQKLKEMGY